MSSNFIDVAIRLLDPDITVPAYRHPGDAGCDLVTTETVTLAPFERRTVPTGIAIALPEGCAAFIHPRSGLSSKRGITVVNAPGTIDAGYRGEIKVPLINVDPHNAVTLERGDRIAQMVIQHVLQAQFILTEELEGSARGADGFGSTGGFGTQAGS